MAKSFTQEMSTGVPAAINAGGGPSQAINLRSKLDDRRTRQVHPAMAGASRPRATPRKVAARGRQGGLPFRVEP